MKTVTIKINDTSTVVTFDPPFIDDLGYKITICYTYKIGSLLPTKLDNNMPLILDCYRKQLGASF